MDPATQPIGAPAPVIITITDVAGQPTTPSSTTTASNGSAYFNNTTGKNVLLNLQTPANQAVQACVIIPAGSIATTVCPPPNMVNGQCPYTVAYAAGTGNPTANTGGGKIIIGSGIEK